MSKAIYSIQNRKTEQLIAHIWDSDERLLLSWTMESSEAARWCAECKQAAYDNLPEQVRRDCMIVIPPPLHDGWEYLCRDCEQEVEAT